MILFFKKEKVTIINEFKGSELVNLEYIPAFIFNDQVEKYKIYADSYVTEQDGTGIVHIAPCYGNDDYRVCLTNKIISKESKLFQPLDVNGFVDNTIPELRGMFYKNFQDKSKQDLNTWTIIQLKNLNLYYDKRQITHNYPFVGDLIHH